MEIDLHGVKHENVGRVLDTFIWEQMQKKNTTIRVITGNSPDMKKIVNEIAYEYGFQVSDEWGSTSSLIINLV
jgi:DNA-nicking Smr family endonuclease